ncbi:hypothetical protein V8C40DRAFT_238152 [Trichoderma camerunense]
MFVRGRKLATNPQRGGETCPSQRACDDYRLIATNFFGRSLALGTFPTVLIHCSPNNIVRPYHKT